MKKSFFVAVGILAVAIFSYLAFGVINSQTSVATAAKAKTYSGDLYVAGMGGHFAKVAVTIDPGDAENPIKVDDLDMLRIGTKDTHPTHDARIDVNDRNIMYWSTYRLDPAGKVHVGKSDLKTGKVIMDAAVDIDPRTKGPAPLYCASGQSKTSFIPVIMATEASIDVFDKKDLKLKHRVFLDGIGYKTGGYKFFHGTNTPDMTGFIVAINIAEGGKGNGNIDLVMLDLPELEKGKVKVLAKNTVTGTPDETITFRQSFTNDGKYLLQAAGDRMFLLDAKTLKLIDEEMMNSGESHDVMPTADGRYAVLTLRTPITVQLEEGSKTITDGMLQLYDIQEKKLVGKAVSVCYGCHAKMGIKSSAVLCGLDGNWK